MKLLLASLLLFLTFSACSKLDEVKTETIEAVGNLQDEASELKDTVTEKVDQVNTAVDSVGNAVESVNTAVQDVKAVTK